MFTAFTVQVCQLLLRRVEQGARLSPDQRGWVFRGNRIAVRFARACLLPACLSTTVNLPQQATFPRPPGPGPFVPPADLHVRGERVIGLIACLEIAHRGVADARQQRSHGGVDRCPVAELSRRDGLSDHDTRLRVA